MKNHLAYLWKLPLCGIAFFIGMAVSGAALPMLGFRSPELPEGTDANTIGLWFLLGSLVLAFALSFVSRSLRANWLVRWAILSELAWVFGAVGMVIESAFFTTTGAASSLLDALYTMLSFLLPLLCLSALVTALFRPAQPSEPCLDCLRRYLAGRKPSEWAWRFGAAWLAYPLVYFAFGLLVQPYIREYYVSGQFELAIPTWGQLIPLQLVRSLSFLAVSLPVIVWWRGSRRGLWLALGVSVFALTAFMAVLTAYWFPWQLRLAHGLELLADGLVYAGALVLLFGREQAEVRERAGRVLVPSAG